MNNEQSEHHVGRHSRQMQEFCLATIKAKIKYQGKRVKCPGCGEGLQIPVGPDLSNQAATQSPLAPLTPSLKPAAVRPEIIDEPVFLDDSAFESVPADDYGFTDAKLDDYEDYGAPLPAPRPRPKPKKKRRPSSRRSEASSGGGIHINGGIIGGILMMVAAVVWFVVGLKFGWLFYYPPVLFIMGIVAVVNGINGD